MSIKEVSLSTGRTINLGNYESLRVEVEATATIDYDLGETPDSVRLSMSAWLREQVKKTIAEQQGK